MEINYPLSGIVLRSIYVFFSLNICKKTQVAANNWAKKLILQKQAKMSREKN